jgi:hypothetical protein
MRTLVLLAISIPLLTAVGCAHEHHERHVDACYHVERVETHYACRPYHDQPHEPAYRDRDCR